LVDGGQRIFLLASTFVVVVLMICRKCHWHDAEQGRSYCGHCTPEEPQPFKLWVLTSAFFVAALVGLVL